MSRFNSPYEQYKDCNGRPFEIIREATMEKDGSIIDEECLPMYFIRFLDGAKEHILAWPEEIGL